MNRLCIANISEAKGGMSSYQSDATQKLSYGDSQFDTNDTDPLYEDDPYQKYLEFRKEKKQDAPDFIIKQKDEKEQNQKSSPIKNFSLISMDKINPG